MTESSWKKRQFEGGHPGLLEPPILLPPPIWDILYSRGYKSAEELEQLFKPQLKDLSHPFVIDDMEKAVSRCVRALEASESILIYGDYDMDGTPGVVLLEDGLAKMGFENLLVMQPSRFKDGYGLHAKKILEAFEKPPQLVVTVDVGITDIEAALELKENGVDVIVTDHHLPKSVLPEAVATLNPNKGSCGSNLGHLCGTGVAFYFILALRMELKKLGLLKSDFNPKSLLDLFALATITDMVPMTAENRVLVKHGLKELEKTERPGLKYLLRELGFSGRSLNSQDVAFRIAPKLNALTRLEEGLKAYDVIRARDSETAKKVVNEALLINQKRVQYQEKAKSIADGLLKGQDTGTSPFVFVHSKDFHPGVISLLASDLMNRFQKPSFVASFSESGQLVGSARSPSREFDLQEILGAVSPVLNKFGGHKMAAGFEIDPERVDEFSGLLSEHLGRHEDAQSGVECVEYDTELDFQFVTPELLRWLEALGPYGVAFENPQFLVSNVKIKGAKKLKETMMKYTIEGPKGETFEAPWFSNVKLFKVGDRVDFVVEPTMNHFMGRSRIQLVVRHGRLSKQGPDKDNSF